MTYPDTTVGQLIHDRFLPVQLRSGSRPDLHERYQAHWTPSILILDEHGRDHHRSVGFLRPEEFMPMLMLGLGKYHFNRGEWDESTRALESLMNDHAGSFFAPEGIYWRAVVAYKESGDPDALGRHWRRIVQEYPGSEWAQKVGYAVT